MPTERVSARAAEANIVNGDMATARSEIDVVQQAAKAGVAQGAEMTMTVKGAAVCTFCRGDIPAAAAAAGLKALTIIEEVSGKTLVWIKGARTLKVNKP